MGEHEGSSLRAAERAAGTGTGDSTPETGISAIIITQNRREILQEALRRLYKSKKCPEITEVIVVDNGSTDGTAEMIRSRFPEVHLIRLPRNLGIPEARNVGALNASRELLLFLDDDGILDYSYIPNVARALQMDQQLAVVACNVIETEAETSRGLPDDRAQTGRGGGTCSLEPIHTFYGGAAMLKRSAFLEAGMFPGGFFYSHEEDDLSLRLIAKGYRLAFCPEATFIHYRAAREEPGARKRRIFYYYRNRQYVIWRNLPRWAAIRESWATLIGGTLRTIFTPYFLPFLAGSAAALVGLARVIRDERFPLSREQYERYRELGQAALGYRRRLRRLLGDLWKGGKLDWI